MKLLGWAYLQRKHCFYCQPDVKTGNPGMPPGAKNDKAEHAEIWRYHTNWPGHKKCFYSSGMWQALFSGMDWLCVDFERVQRCVLAGQFPQISSCLLQRTCDFFVLVEKTEWHLSRPPGTLCNYTMFCEKLNPSVRHVFWLDLTSEWLFQVPPLSLPQITGETVKKSVRKKLNSYVTGIVT